MTLRLLPFAGLGLALTALALVPARPPALSSALFAWDAAPAKATPTGAARAFFQGPTSHLAELECHATTLRPGLDPHPPHQHPEEELYIVKEGTVEVLLNTERQLAGPGSVVFVAANQPHGIRNAGSTPATYHVIKWRPARNDGDARTQESP